MIEHKETFTVKAGPGCVWDTVHEMANWAACFPGYQSFEVIDDVRSRWTVKVALGALTRTVRVVVTVTEWVAPKRVAFVLEGETEPITGSGSFDAEVDSDGTTLVHLGLALAGSGPMASAMEAMSGPVLPRLGGAFARELRQTIEAGAVEPEGASRTAEAAPPLVPAAPMRPARAATWPRRWAVVATAVAAVLVAAWALGAGRAGRR